MFVRSIGAIDVPLYDATIHSGWIDDEIFEQGARQIRTPNEERPLTFEILVGEFPYRRLLPPAKIFFLGVPSSFALFLTAFCHWFSEDHVAEAILCFIIIRPLGLDALDSSGRYSARKYQVSVAGNNPPLYTLLSLVLCQRGIVFVIKSGDW